MSLARSVGSVIVALLLVRASPVRAEGEDVGQPEGLRLARTIRLPELPAADPELGPGRFDHLAYDPVTKRLFVAAIAHRTLEVIDLEKGAPFRSLGKLGHPAGVVVVPLTGQVVVSCASDGNLVAFDASTLEEVGRLALGDEPDNVRIVGDRIYVGYGSDEAGGIAGIDPRKLAKVSEVPIPGHPESFQLTPDATRVYVNLPQGKQAAVDGSVVVGDVAASRVEATWPLPKLAQNFPMALDVAGKRLFVGSRKPARLTCMDTTTGEIRSSVPCGDDADDLFFDAKAQRVIVISGGGKAEGSLELFAVDAAGKLTRSAGIETPSGSRTGLFVPDLGVVYVAVPRREGRIPEIREYVLPR